MLKSDLVIAGSNFIFSHIKENYSKYLTYDLKRNFEEKREKDLKESPFDAIINEDLGINTKEL